MTTLLPESGKIKAPILLWYKNSDYIRQQAVRDKRLFLAGKSIPEERMREYLRAAGWEQIQEEQWAEK